MNIITLEPERLNRLQKWWLEPEAGELIGCLDMAAKKAMAEYADLMTKSKANANNNFANAADEKLLEAARLETALDVLKSFFPDGPFIAKIEL